MCKAPCAGLISKADYAKIVHDVISLLSGRAPEVMKGLKEEMERAAENLEFEKAAAIRDKINAVTKVQERQNYYWKL